MLFVILNYPYCQLKIFSNYVDLLKKKRTSETYEMKSDQKNRVYIKPARSERMV